MPDRDPCPLTIPLCAGIVIGAYTLIWTQVMDWSLAHGLGVSALVGFGTWAMIGAFQIVGIAWELWRQDRRGKDEP